MAPQPPWLARNVAPSLTPAVVVRVVVLVVVCDDTVATRLFSDRVPQPVPLTYVSRTRKLALVKSAATHGEWFAPHAASDVALPSV